MMTGLMHSQDNFDISAKSSSAELFEKFKYPPFLAHWMTNHNIFRIYRNEQTGSPLAMVSFRSSFKWGMASTVT